MTTITLTLPDELAARLAALPDELRSRFSHDMNVYAVATLEQIAGHADADFQAADAREQASWDALTPAEQEASREALARSLAAADAGRVRPAEQVFADLEARHGISVRP